MIFAVPPTAIWETSNYLWNSDGQGTLTAWTYIITSYYPIQLWWSRYSALNELGRGVGVQCGFYYDSRGPISGGSTPGLAYSVDLQ